MSLNGTNETTDILQCIPHDCEYQCCVENHCGASFLACNGPLAISLSILGGILFFAITLCLCWKLATRFEGKVQQQPTETEAPKEKEVSLNESSPEQRNDSVLEGLHNDTSIHTIIHVHSCSSSLEFGKLQRSSSVDPIVVRNYQEDEDKKVDSSEDVDNNYEKNEEKKELDEDDMKQERYFVVEAPAIPVENKPVIRMERKMSVDDLIRENGPIEKERTLKRSVTISEIKDPCLL